jgi:hypothetical protein
MNKIKQHLEEMGSECPADKVVQYAMRKAKTLKEDDVVQAAVYSIFIGQAAQELADEEMVNNKKHTTRESQQAEPKWAEAERSTSNEVRKLAGNSGMGPKSSHMRGSSNFAEAAQQNAQEQQSPAPAPSPPQPLATETKQPVKMRPADGKKPARARPASNGKQPAAQPSPCAGAPSSSAAGDDDDSEGEDVLHTRLKRCLGQLKARPATELAGLIHGALGAWRTRALHEALGGKLLLPPPQPNGTSGGKSTSGGSGRSGSGGGGGGNGGGGGAGGGGTLPTYAISRKTMPASAMPTGSPTKKALSFTPAATA